MPPGILDNFLVVPLGTVDGRIGSPGIITLPAAPHWRPRPSGVIPIKTLPMTPLTPPDVSATNNAPTKPGCVHMARYAAPALCSAANPLYIEPTDPIDPMRSGINGTAASDVHCTLAYESDRLRAAKTRVVRRERKKVYPPGVETLIGGLHTSFANTWAWSPPAAVDTHRRLPPKSKKAKLMEKFSQRTAPETTIVDIVTSVIDSLDYFNTTNETQILAFIYIERLKEEIEGLEITPENALRLVLTALRCATKYLQDDHCDNHYFARAGGIELAEFNSLELVFAFCLNFHFYVSTSVYEEMQRRMHPRPSADAAGESSATNGHHSSGHAAVAVRRMRASTHDEPDNISTASDTAQSIGANRGSWGTVALPPCDVSTNHTYGHHRRICVCNSGRGTGMRQSFCRCATDRPSDCSFDIEI